HAAVLVDVGRWVIERLYEEFGKGRFELLRRRVGRCQHHAAAPGDFSQKRKASAARVDKDERARDWLDEIRPLARAEIGADEIELRVLAVERRAMTDQEHEKLIVLGRFFAEITQHTPNVLARRLQNAGA